MVKNEYVCIHIVLVHYARNVFSPFILHIIDLFNRLLVKLEEEIILFSHVIYKYRTNNEAALKLQCFLTYICRLTLPLNN